MKKSLIVFCLMCIACVSAQGWAGVNWQTDYASAMNQAASTGKPVILFFTGSDWCGWCSKLDSEVLETDEFARLVGDKFIFVKVDFPLYKPQDPQLTAANKALQEKYDVRGFPALIIVDKTGRQIGVTGYRAGGPKLYADHLLEKTDLFSSLN